MNKLPLFIFLVIIGTNSYAQAKTTKPIAAKATTTSKKAQQPVTADRYKAFMDSLYSIKNGMFLMVDKTGSWEHFIENDKDKDVEAISYIIYYIDTTYFLVKAINNHIVFRKAFFCDAFKNISKHYTLSDLTGMGIKLKHNNEEMALFYYFGKKAAAISEPYKINLDYNDIDISKELQPQDQRFVDALKCIINEDE